MAENYYATGVDLRAKNELAAQDGPDIPGWVLGHLDLSTVTTALDAGAGWGRFAGPLLNRAKALPALICADLSPGMLATCRSTLAESRSRASFVCADVRALPLPAGSCDLALANHMLYELADPAVAAAELARVLRPGGTLVATTYSETERVHLVEFHRDAMAGLGIQRPPEQPSSFCLENGDSVLRPSFDEVTVLTLRDERVLNVGQLTQEYLHTGRYLSVMRDAAVPVKARRALAEAFRANALAAEAREGGLNAKTVWALFVARLPTLPERALPWVARSRPAERAAGSGR